MPTDITAVLIETTVGGPDGSHIGAVLVETTVALDYLAAGIDITAVLIETTIGRLPQPAPPPPYPRTYRDIAEKRFGRDLVLPAPGRAVRPTASGDWPVVGGRPNLHAAQRRRVITTPTQMVHRPDYGGGLELAVGTQATPTERARLATSIRQNALRDARIEEAQVSVSETAEGATLVELDIRPTGEVEPEEISVVTDEV